MQADYKNHLFVLIMAGGGGTRLWPKSREKTPKQFLKLFNKKTLFEIAFERSSKLAPLERIYVTTATESYARKIRELVPKIKKENLIVEPVRKDTAPSHGLGALLIQKRDPNAVIVNVASDHLIYPEVNYRRTMYVASKIAYESDVLIAVGISPTYPHTGMGYIKRGKRLKRILDRYVYKLDKFVEKPGLSLAKRYFRSNNYFWNANQYVWSAKSFLNALKKHAPDIYKNLKLFEKHIGSKNQESALKKYYNMMPKISVDYAVSEKAKNFVMLEADYEWTDIGDWNEVWKNLHKDEYGNVIIDGEEPGGFVYNIDTSDTLIQTNGRLVAVVDVDNVIVIDTKDALLVCSKSRAQSVKKIVEMLKADGRKELL